MNLDFLGTPVRLTAEPGPALEELTRDFASFPPAGGEPAVRVRLCGARCPAPAGPWRWGWRDFAVRRRPGGRLVRWDDGSWADCDWARREVQVHAEDPERLRELGWLATLSRAGEELDRRGLHRVHALGVCGPSGAGLLLLPSGGGKSSIALELLRRRGPLTLLSDESPLVGRDGLVHAFPLRVALRPGGAPAPEGARLRPFRRRGYEAKQLLEPAPPPRPPAPAAWLLLGEPSEGEPSFAPLSSARALAALAAPLVVGAGLAQMAEYMARPDPALASIAASRAAAALALARRARAGRLRLGSRGPAASADLLERVMGAA